MSEQRSDKIQLTLASALRTGYRDKREKAGTKRESMLSWTKVGMGRREEEVIGPKTYVKGSGNQIC